MAKPTDAALLLAILRIAREECAHINWNELEPVLAAAWDDLRDDSTPQWEILPTTSSWLADEMGRFVATTSKCASPFGTGGARCP